MKNMKTPLYYFLLMALPLLIISCSKEGPTGPAGPTGAQGTTGAAGPAGPAGAAGTANVIYSGWLDVPFAADTIHSGAVIDTIGYYADVNAPKLTNTILTSGDIKVYVNAATAAAPVIFPLPYVDVYYGLNIDASFKLQTISLYSNFNSSTYTSGGNKYLQYRYILVPGGVPARIMPDGSAVDWNNYASVQKYLGLKD